MGWTPRKTEYKRTKKYRNASRRRIRRQWKSGKIGNKKHGKLNACLICGAIFYVSISRSKKAKYCSKRCSGLSRRGKQLGENSPHWKGGATSVALRLRHSIKMTEWRQSVFMWDNFTCRDCGKIGGKLEAHHIKPLSVLMQEVRKLLPLMDFYEACIKYVPMWNLNNGKTLCKKCHKKYKKTSLGVI